MKKIFLFATLILSLLVSSCSLSKVSSLPAEILSIPSSTPAASATPAPTATPTPTPTPLPAVRISQAEYLLLTGDYNAALEEYRIALNSATDSETQAEAMLGTGRAQFELKNYNPAIQAFLTVTENYPDSPYLSNAYYFLGQCYTLLENYSGAADAYASYLASDPNSPLTAAIQELRGDALTSTGDYAQALAAYQAAYDAPKLGDGTQLAIKIGGSYTALEDYENALKQYWKIYEAAPNDYIKAQMDYLLGQVYLTLGIPDQAYARFQEAVLSYPLSYYSYLGLIELVDNGVEVSDLNRGLVDYFAQQYGVAIDAFDRYLASTPEQDATALYYKAKSLQAIDEPEKAVAVWQEIIDNYQSDRFWIDAWEDKAYTQWYYMDDYIRSAATYLEFVKRFPTMNEAPSMLYEAGRVQERNNQLHDAADTWERLINEYPAAAQSYRALFLSAITRYRLGETNAALLSFQRLLVLATNPGEQSSAYFWIGKTQQALNKPQEALEAWSQAAQRDPTGYYSERAKELLAGLPPLATNGNYDFDYDLTSELKLADGWLRVTFDIPMETNLESPGELLSDPRMQRGNAFWQLGLYDDANAEFEAMRLSFQDDPVNSFRLLQHLVDLGFYRQAIFTSRQILNLAQMDDLTTLTAPDYFNHIRFGTYFKELILPAAEREGIDPLFLFSLIRQESLFDGIVHSSAGARGLMQIIPSTGQDLASQLNWPPDYSAEDLYRPNVSVTLGAHYLARQIDYFDGNLYQALAAYNAGPGNAQTWNDLAGGDPDLFLEIIRYSETNLYLTQISEFLHIYQTLYQKDF